VQNTLHVRLMTTLTCALFNNTGVVSIPVAFTLLPYQPTFSSPTSINRK